MATDPKPKIVSISQFLGPQASPSDSPSRPPAPPDRHPVRQPALVMRRFLVRGFYRRHDRGGYWYARITDLKTGRTFRMSSREKRRKKAAETIRVELRVMSIEQAEREAAEAGDRRADDPMTKLACELTGKELPRPPRIVAEWVEDENYQRMMEAVKIANELALRGQEAITTHTELEKALARLIPQRPEPQGPFFEVAFEEFLKTKDVRPATLRGYEETGRLFHRFLKPKHVHEITGLEVQKFVDCFKGDGKAQRTRQKHLNLLRSFFRWARDVAKYVTEDPTAGIKIRVLKSQRKKKRKGLSLEDATRLLAACRLKRKQKRHDIQHVWLAAFISLRTGLRLDNILALTWSRVDLENGLMHIPPDQYKTDRSEDFEIPIHRELWRVLRLWKRLRTNSPLVTDQSFVLGKRLKQIIGPFKSAAKRADVSTDFHNLRHAFETWLVEHDVPSPVQKELMGHSSSSCQTEDYAHPSIDKMRECVNRLPRLRRSPAVPSCRQG